MYFLHSNSKKQSTSNSRSMQRAKSSPRINPRIRQKRKTKNTQPPSVSIFVTFSTTVTDRHSPSIVSNFQINRQVIKASETNYYQEKPEILWRKTTFSLFFLNHNIFYRGLDRHQIWRSRNLSVYKKLWQLVTTDKLTTYSRGKRNDYNLAIYICKNLFQTVVLLINTFQSDNFSETVCFYTSLSISILSYPGSFCCIGLGQLCRRGYINHGSLNDEFLFCKLKSKPIIAFNF